MSAHSPLPDDLPESASLVAQMRPALVKFFKRKTGSTAEAEDLAQDVLVSALTHTHWKSPAEAKGYIFRSAVNRWRDRHRRLQTHGVTVAWNENNACEAGAENPPECVLIAQEELNQVARALRELNSRTRTVLMLVRLEQMKIATVADALGISVSAVNKHLAKAAARLAQLRNTREEER